MESVKEKNVYISALRALACALVFCVHINNRLNVPGSIGYLMDWGSTCPVLFYMISGYFAFGSKELASGNVAKYYKKRAVRILPTYFVTTLLFFFAHIIAIGKVTVYQAIIFWTEVLLFGHIFVDAPEEWQMGVVWSAQYFVGFYLLMPLLYRLIKNLKEAVICFGVALVVSHVWAASPLESYLSSGFAHALCGFLAGVIIYYVVRENRNYLMLFVTTMAVLFTVVIGHQNRITNMGFYMVLLGTAIHIEPVRMPRICSGILAFFDKYSYHIFITHSFILLVADLIWKSNYNISYIVSTVLMTIILSVVMEKCVDQSVRKIISKIRTRG